MEYHLVTNILDSIALMVISVLELMRNEQIQPIVEKTIRYDRMRKNKFRIKLRL